MRCKYGLQVCGTVANWLECLACNREGADLSVACDSYCVTQSLSTIDVLSCSHECNSELWKAGDIKLCYVVLYCNYGAF